MPFTLIVHRSDTGHGALRHPALRGGAFTGGGGSVGGGLGGLSGGRIGGTPGNGSGGGSDGGLGIWASVMVAQYWHMLAGIFWATLRRYESFRRRDGYLAGVLATAPDARLRDGPRAVRLAEKAVSLLDDAHTRDHLAAAYAEASRFRDAVDAQERAVSIARAEGSSASDIADMEDRLRLYRQGRPYREKR